MQHLYQLAPGSVAAIAATSPGVGVGGDQHDAGQAAGDQAAEERQPSRAVLGTGDVQAQDLPLAVSLGWQYMLLAGLREMSGEIAAAAAALATAGPF